MSLRVEFEFCSRGEPLGPVHRGCRSPAGFVMLCLCAGGPEETRFDQLHLLRSHQTGPEDHQVPAAAQGTASEPFHPNDSQIYRELNRQPQKARCLFLLAVLGGFL